MRSDFNQEAVRPTMAARSYMQENTFNKGDGKATLVPLELLGECATDHLGP